jgi:hypothetical protein
MNKQIFACLALGLACLAAPVAWSADATNSPAISQKFTYVLVHGACGGGWRRDYNEARPHSSLEYLAPAVFAVRWRAPVGASPLPAHASAVTLKP